jgi:hypothetical protein
MKWGVLWVSMVYKVTALEDVEILVSQLVMVPFTIRRGMTGEHKRNQTRLQVDPIL